MNKMTISKDKITNQLDLLELMLSDMSNVTMHDIEEWLKETRKCVE